ncbi:unnamed protein product [Prorocentrum cordatum]|uniref:Uncharacterized protein n=1 Tax=Prorocentrum cordatum TaxID=2364126 RepID=A0ABN9YFT4_9DINO|nr:unnamed protein product [Polarella glacialis]
MPTAEPTRICWSVTWRSTRPPRPVRHPLMAQRALTRRRPRIILGFVVEELGLGVGPGREEYSRFSFHWQQHLLLQPDAEGTNPRVMFVLSCWRCGAVSSDGTLNPTVSSLCLGQVGKGTSSGGHAKESSPSTEWGLKTSDKVVPAECSQR